MWGANSMGVAGRGVRAGHYQEHDQPPAPPVISWWVIRGGPRQCHVMTPLPNTDTQAPLVVHKGGDGDDMLVVDLAMVMWWYGVTKYKFLSERTNPKTFYSRYILHDFGTKKCCLEKMQQTHHNWTQSIKSMHFQANIWGHCIPFNHEWNSMNAAMLLEQTMKQRNSTTKINNYHIWWSIPISQGAHAWAYDLY